MITYVRSKFIESGCFRSKLEVGSRSLWVTTPSIRVNIGYVILQHLSLEFGVKRKDTFETKKDSFIYFLIVPHGLCFKKIFHLSICEQKLETLYLNYISFQVE